MNGRTKSVALFLAILVGVALFITWLTRLDLNAVYLIATLATLGMIFFAIVYLLKGEHG